MPNRLTQFWKELKRRNVVRVIVVYAGAAFVITEVISNISEPLHLPDWIATAVILLLIIGFPVTAILSWIFDITPEGVIKTGPDEQPGEITSGQEQSRRKLKVSDGIIAGLIVVVCILLYPKIFGKDDLNSMRDPDGKISLAVMPFENLTGDSSLNYWQRGIPEILINTLGASDELLVASSLTMSELNKSMGIPYTATLFPEMAKKTADRLNAKIYINGKYQKSGDRMRIMVNMIDTDDGSVLWSKKVDGGQSTDYLLLSDSIGQILKNYLEIEAIKEVVDHDYQEAFTNSSDAYRYYVEGVDLILNDDYVSAKQKLTRALEIDSSFVMALFYMAWVDLYGPVQSHEGITNWISKAHQYMDQLPSIYQNWLGVWYSIFVSRDREEILRYCELISKSEIKSRMILFDIGLTYSNFGFHQKAVDEYEKIMDINSEWDKNWENPAFYKGSSYIYGSNSYHEIGMHQRENEIYQLGLTLFPDDADIISRQAICALSRNDTAYANERIQRTKSLFMENGRTELDLTLRLAAIFEGAGLFSKAEELYRKAIEIDPDDLWTSYLLINMLIINDIDLTRAREMNQRILDSKPDEINFIRNKGILYVKQGNYMEGLELLRRFEEEVLPFEESTDPYVIMAEKALVREGASIQ